MLRRILSLLVIVLSLVRPVEAKTISWVDFDVPYESLKYAMEVDIATFEQEKHLSWVDILALAACRTGGKCGLASVKKAVLDLKEDKSPEELLNGSYKHYDYYHKAYQAVLGGLLGSFAIEKDGQWIPKYGLKAFSPIAQGYGYTHCDDFGFSRSFGFSRKHRGNDLMGRSYKHYDYYHKAYQAVLGGLLGSFAIEKDGQWIPKYGLKAFSPIAQGYGYSHCDDFGFSRSFGFSRKHRGNDLMGSLGTPIVAVESGVVEALGWNRYGGWRIGIRSTDSKRYYYYAHLQKDHPYVEGLQVGDMVQAGDVIGFMGRTGYSDEENVNNIGAVHLHFGLQLVFDESQKETDAEIWVDVYDIVRLLSEHRSTVVKGAQGWQRRYPWKDLDTENFLE